MDTGPSDPAAGNAGRGHAPASAASRAPPGAGLAPVAVAFFGLAIVALVLALLLRPDGGGGSNDGGAGGGSTGSAGGAVRLSAARDYDPDGDGHEHPEDVADATDGDPATYWTTETYNSFSKPGVGLVLRAPKPVALASLTVTSDEPGYTAEIQAASSAGGPFEPVSSKREVGERTTFRVDTNGADYRYYLVWITQLDGRAHVNEVRARTGDA